VSQWTRSASAAFVWGGLSLPSAVAAQFVFTADAGAYNAYVWRGVTLTNQMVLQPDAYLTIPAGGGSAVLGFWGTIDAGRYDDPVNDLSEGGGTSSLNATELNVWAEYGHSLGSRLTGTVGGLIYLFPNESGLTNDVNRTLEVYGKLQLATPLSPKLAAWYDLDKVNGLYLEGSVSHTVPVIESFPLTLGALAGFSGSQGINDADPAEIANFAGNTLTHLDLSATGVFRLGSVTLSPTVHFLLPNDDFARITKPTVTKDAKAWAGVSLSWSKQLTRPEPASE
jgi:hypothetical protein